MPSNSAVPPDTFGDAPPPDLKTVLAATERSAEYIAFLKYVAQSTGFISYEQMAILYPAICQGAMEWLLQEKKSVDFGFMIMHPSPHRGNWKQALVALFPKLGPTIVGKSRLEREALLTASGLPVKMLSGELLAVSQERYVVWGIETELKRSWWKAMFRYESAKFKRLGSTGYAAYIARAITDLRVKLIRSYVSFLRQISYPCARIHHSRVFGGRGFIVPFVPKGKVRPVADSDIPVDYVVPRDPEKIAPPELAEVVPTDAGLPQLPSIQFKNQDLRVGGGAKVEIRRGT